MFIGHGLDECFGGIAIIFSAGIFISVCEYNNVDKFGFTAANSSKYIDGLPGIFDRLADGVI